MYTRPVPGFKETYTVQVSKLERVGPARKGQMRAGYCISIAARGYSSAKKAFIAKYKPPRGTQLTIWPQSDPTSKKKCRVT